MQASNNNYEDNNGQFQQLRHSQNANQMPMNAENRSAWPTNMSFASMAQQNVGFNTTNVGHHKHRANYNNGFSQAKAARNQNFVDKHPDLPDILRLINSNYRVLICMRGAPGSGKSYLARAIVDRTMNANYGDHIFTTDDFFIDARTKQYRYDRSRLSQAHEWNQSSVAHRAASGWSPIIIDNTNMKLWEMVPYLREAISNGYLIRIVEPNTPWRIAVGKLAQRNSHGVDQEQIARMLTNYEPGTVKDVLSSMQIFNYDNPEPKLRNLPEIRERPKNAPLEPLSRFPPKEQRPERHFIQGDRYRFNRVEPETEIDLASKLPDLDKKWTPFEQESETFWGQGMAQPNENGVAALKPQRQTSAETNIANMYKILKDRSNTKATAATTSDDTDAAQALKRHKKFCRNENQSFQTIRQICSNIPISLLWDLFEKCNGNGDWTMDIILNEREAMGIQTLDTQEQIDRDNFTCECDGPVVSNEPAESVNAIIESTKPRSVAAQSMRRKQMADTGDEVRKQFNDLFVIPHKHYSEHTQKIRDFRYGTAAPPTATATAATMINDDDDAGAAGGTENDDGQEEHDDIIEMDLGIELVCQLDQNFGSNAFQHGQLKDMKTTVFMPKALGQQLYAIWVESLYHQLEEQRQQSIKEDEEFAKVLHKQEQSEALPQPLAATKPKITDLADIEYAWKAYNTNFNEWKQSRPEDLATKLTKDKLFDIFPNVDRQQLLHVFSAYSNNFKETVEFFKEEIKSDVDNKMLTNGQKLLDHVRLEAETVRRIRKIRLVLFICKKVKFAKVLNWSLSSRQAYVFVP